ncbi:MAG: hypothetical protein D6776_01535 [Planctomycetota bacterium]|nr:MAG: hypothetical protein D6776_01535 [Planctomycetota bacterium]
MLRLLTRVSQIGFSLAVTAAIVWFLWDKIGGEPRRELDPYRQVLAERAVRQLAHEVPRRDEIRKLVVAPVVRDVDDRVTDLLVDALEDEQLYFLVSPSTVRDTIDKRFGGRRPRTLEDAVALARAIAQEDPAVEGVLFTILGHFSDGRRGIGAHVELKGWLARLDTGEPVPGGLVGPVHATIRGRLDLDWIAATMRSIALWKRLGIWLIFTAGLPFALSSVVARVTRLRSNRANAWLLAGLVGASVALGWLLMGLRIGWGGVLVLLLGALVAFVYDFTICDQIDEAQR